MTPERLAAIIADATGKGNMLGTVEDALRETAALDWKVAAKAENTEYIGTVHGRRAGRAELLRIENEILHEHETRHRTELARALGMLKHAHSQELPTLEAYLHECEEPQTAMEMYEAAVSDRGSADRPLTLALLERVTRRDVRAELARMGPTAALNLYRRAQHNGIGPDAVVRRAVLIAEIERRPSWHYDPKGENAAEEHAASLELQKLVATTKATRVPRKLCEVLDAARAARKFADTLQQALKVRPMTPAELFDDQPVADRYKAHPAIQRAMQRRDERR